MMKRFMVCVLVAAAAGAYGCSDDDSGTPTPAGTNNDGGTSTGDGGTSSGDNATLTVQMIGYTSQTGVENIDVKAQVAAGSEVVAKTNNKGTAELAVKKGANFNILATDPAGGYFDEYDQEMSISGDYDHGKLRFVDKSIGQTLLALVKADASKGVVSVGLKANDACNGKAADFPQGAKITVEGQPDAKVVYYKGTPNADLTEAQATQDPAAIVINAAPGQDLKLKVEYAKCTMRAFPVTEDTVTFTGKIQPKGNSTLSVYRMFFE